MTKEILKLALEALENIKNDPFKFDLKNGIDKAITAIKEALAQPEPDWTPERIAGMARLKEAQDKKLAQPEQTNTRPYYTIDELNAWADEKEKQAWRNAAIRIGEELSSVGPDGYYEMDAWKWLDWAMEQKPRGKNSLAQTEQKPMHPQLKAMLEEYFDKCFAESAPQRKPLSDEEAQQIFAKHNCTISTHLAGILTRAIEAKLKEKNT